MVPTYTPEWADGALLFDGFEDAIIGFGTHFTRPVVIYSYDRMVGQLAAEIGADCDKSDACQNDHWAEAEEYIEFNTAGAWLGENTPIILRETVADAMIREQVDLEPQGCKHCGNVANGCACNG